MTKEYPYTTAVLSPFRRRMDRMASAPTLLWQSIQQLTVALASLEERVTVLTEASRYLRKHITEKDREIRDLQITSGILSSFTLSDG